MPPYGSAPQENRANGANPLVSLANFLAALVDDGTLSTNGFARMTQFVAWDGKTEGLLPGSSVFPDILEMLVSRFNAIHPDTHLTFETRNLSVPDIRNPDGERFQRVRTTYEEVVGEPCPLVAVGGHTDAHGHASLLAAGVLFSSDFGPPVNFHGIEEGAPIADLRLRAQILWHILLRSIGDPAM